MPHTSSRSPLTQPASREIEKPDALLPTVGGQTALNLAMDLDKAALKEFDVELIGARPDAIALAEDRQLFKAKMIEEGYGVPPSGVAHLRRGRGTRQGGLPAIIRPSFTLGGEGGGVAYNVDEFREIVMRGLDFSDQSAADREEHPRLEEFELELMRISPTSSSSAPSRTRSMGVHTGDSITVGRRRRSRTGSTNCRTSASASCVRSALRRVARTFSLLNPENGDIVVIEMNPRQSLLRARLEGHGLPDRQDRGPARGRPDAG